MRPRGDSLLSRADSLVARAAMPLCAARDVRAVADALGDLFVPELATACVIDLGPRAPVAVRHRDLAVAAEIRRGWRTGPLVPRAIGEGLLRLGSRAIAALEASDPHRLLAERVEARSLVVVPLACEREVLGVLTLASGEAHAYDALVAAIEALARLAASALARAREHGEALDDLRVARANGAALSALVENTPLGFACFDRGLRVTTANEAFAAMCGVALDAVHGAAAGKLGVPAPDRLEAALRGVLAGTPRSEIDLVVPARYRARERVVRAVCHPIAAADGGTAGVAAFFADVSEDRRSEQLARATSLATAAIASSHDASSALASHVVPLLAEWAVVHVRDEHGAFRAVAEARRTNGALPAALRAAKSASDEVASGRTVVRSAEDVALSCSKEIDLAAALSTTGAGPQLLVPIASGDRVVGVLTLGRASRDPGFLPDEVHAAEVLARAAAAAIAAIAKQADAVTALHLFEDFLDVVARELRDPLTALRGRLFLAERASDIEFALTHLAPIGAVLRRTHAVLDRLLATRLPIEAPRDAEAVDVGALAREAVAREAKRLDGRRVTMHLHDRLHARVDAERLRGAIRALLRHAADEAPKDGLLCVRVERDGHEVSVSVSDTGHGLPVDRARKAFDGLWSATEDPALTLARATIDAHGGRVWIETAPGLGAAYCFALPAADPA